MPGAIAQDTTTVLPAERASRVGVWSLAVVLLIGTALVLPRLGAQSLWLDEGLTVEPAVTATSLADLVAKVRMLDTQPPASHFILWMLQPLPHTELVYRLPSFVCVELGLVLLYLIARRLWGATAALAIATCAQLSPYLAFYAAEARNYGLWFLCITASVYCALHWLDADRAGDVRRRRRWALVLAVVNALGLWTHLFHAFVTVAEAAILGAIVATDPAAGRGATHASSRVGALALLAATQVVTALLFVPWAVTLWHAAQEGSAGVPWTREFSAGSVGYYLYAVHFGASLGPNLRELHFMPLSMVLAAHRLALGVGAVAIAVTGIAYALLVRDAVRRHERRWELVPLVAWPLLSLPAPFAYAALRDFPLHPRHLLFAWPVVPIVLGLAFVRMRRLRPFVAAAVAVQVVALVNLLFNGYYAKDDERGAVRFAEERSGPVAYVIGDVASLYATRIDGERKGFLAFPADTDDVWLIDNRTWDEQNQRVRRQLAIRARAMGMRRAENTSGFRGIVLRHWTRPS